MTPPATSFTPLLHLVRQFFRVRAAALLGAEGLLACDGSPAEQVVAACHGQSPDLRALHHQPLPGTDARLILLDAAPLADDLDTTALADFARLAADLLDQQQRLQRMQDETTVLKENEQRLALAVAGSGTGIWDRDVVNGRIHYSPGWKSMLGYAVGEISDRIEDSYNRVHPDDLDYVRHTMLDHFEQRTPDYQVEHRLQRKDGSYIWVSSRGKVVERDEQGRALRMIGTTTDITEMKRMARRLEQNIELLTDLTNEIPGMVFQYLRHPDGSGEYRYVSAGSLDIYGLSPEQVKVGRERILALIHPDDLPGYLNALETSAMALTPWHREYRVCLASGEVGWRLGSAHPKRLGDGSVLWHGFITDISEQKRIEAELQALAITDFLTQLPNRRHFMTRLEEQLARLQRPGNSGAALLMFDLDHFKGINDRWGHSAGDEALRHFAALLSEQMRRVDFAGRMGGEEFAVVLNDADHRSAMVFAQRLQQRLEDVPLLYQGERIPLTVSIGITTLGADDITAAGALSRSDMALYRAKAEGRNRIEVH